ncbi:type II toxin-antitoxin system HipA family toxin [Fibrobacter intestinalis]|uniref:Serine/threonine-protein kinase HipA n=1 Tax=Fibrobacter intestinalis TaxID=28122 RepID=A0A1T4K2B1_9BACT|nr:MULTISPECIES: type II toxin-antitoxin system HipA family toxin [Fibrobacter]PBC74233.1 serine/threonine-protein kinase HipA [Fibrobacter sp. NR9]SJZ36622.1 serine/threonine-protein kinase HipA [Fibrobacter intestinalis]
MKLSVYFGESLAGHLSSTAENGIVFSYEASYLEAELPPISLSLPLNAGEFSQKQCLPFFEGLLPEGDVKRKISDFLHVSETSTLKLLKELGGECAGMISILPEDEPNKAKDVYDFSPDNYEPVPIQKISEYIKNINSRPLLKVKEELRLSLAGAQEKLPLLYKDGEYYLPRNGAPSTHIIKPTGHAELSTLSANEYICIKLAEHSGLPVPNTELKHVDGSDFLLIERYDRIFKDGKLSRIHQEDVCQALGILSDYKYQNDGGPSIADIYNLLKEKTSIPLLEMRAFLQYVLFNFIIGNCDAHGKNYSIMYKNNSIKLTPVYDTVCTLAYPNLANKLSMKIGKHSEIRKVNKEDFAILAEQLGLKTKIIIDAYLEVFGKIINAFEIVKADSSLNIHRDIIECIEQNILKRKLI